MSGSKTQLIPLAPVVLNVALIFPNNVVFKKAFWYHLSNSMLLNINIMDSDIILILEKYLHIEYWLRPDLSYTESCISSSMVGTSFHVFVGLKCGAQYLNSNLCLLIMYPHIYDLTEKTSCGEIMVMANLMIKLYTMEWNYLLMPTTLCSLQSLFHNLKLLHFYWCLRIPTSKSNSQPIWLEVIFRILKCPRKGFSIVKHIIHIITVFIAQAYILTR